MAFRGGSAMRGARGIAPVQPCGHPVRLFGECLDAALSGAPCQPLHHGWPHDAGQHRPAVPPQCARCLPRHRPVAWASDLPHLPPTVTTLVCPRSRSQKKRRHRTPSPWRAVDLISMRYTPPPTPESRVSVSASLPGEGKAPRASHLLRVSSPWGHVSQKHYKSREKSHGWISLICVTHM
jgi:hypothetical protein